MKPVQVLALACLLSSPSLAAAQDALPPGDVAIFSVFHARLVAAGELSSWAAEHLENGKARGTARKVAGHSRDGHEYVTKFLGKYGATVQPVTEDSLALAAAGVRQYLESFQGRALDSAYAHHMTLWLDAARVRAIFVDGKQIEHKKARGAESNLRGAWGFGYGFACALRTWFDKTTLDGRKLDCGPPSEPAEGQAARTDRAAFSARRFGGGCGASRGTPVRPAVGSRGVAAGPPRCHRGDGEGAVRVGENALRLRAGDPLGLRRGAAARVDSPVRALVEERATGHTGAELALDHVGAAQGAFRRPSRSAMRLSC